MLMLPHDPGHEVGVALDILLSFQKSLQKLRVLSGFGTMTMGLDQPELQHRGPGWSGNTFLARPGAL